jgi:repressor LexA
MFATEEETVESLTRRQEQVLEFIRESVRVNGYPPTVREICIGLDLSSPSTVHVHLANLERLGLLRRDPSKPRALELAQDLRPPRPLPLVGRVAAGQPILAEDNVEEYVDVPSFLRRDDGDFVLRVSGDSMIGAGINDGDYLVVHPQQEVARHEIAVVRVDGDEATAKHFARDGLTVRLEAENENYEPIVVDAGRVELVGKVVGVLRQL